MNFQELIASNEERDRKEAEQLKSLWADIEPGEAELTEEATITRGGLRLLKSDHSVELQPIQLLSIEGQFALCKYSKGPYFVTELISRNDIKGMRSVAPAPEAKPANPKYWVAD